MAAAVGYLFSCSLTVLFLFVLKPVRSQTKCSISVPVPHLGVCDAVGALEENTEASVHEARGKISGMKEYQDDTFKLFDSQITSYLNQSSRSESEIRDIEEEISTLKRFLGNIQALQTFTGTGSNVSAVRRSKRAATLPPSQQTILDNAKLSFQTSLSDILLRLQNMTQILADDKTQYDTYHRRLVQELNTNQRGLNIVEQQLQGIDASIKAVLSQRFKGSGNSGSPGGPSLAGVTQDVMNLIIDGSVAEQLSQRQLDNLNATISQMETKEAKVGTDIPQIDAKMSNMTQDLKNMETQTNINVAAEQILENNLNTFVTDRTKDIADVQAILGPAEKKLSSTSRELLNATIQLGTLEVNVNATSSTVGGLKSLLLLAKSSQLAQLTDMLQLRRKLIDSINAMKYAFGLLTKLP